MSFSLKTFFIDTPLYQSVTFDNIPDFHMFNDGDSVFDGFNPIKGIETTFQIDRCNHGYHNWEYYFQKGGFAKINILCKRTDTKFKFYILWIPESKEVIKVGQYPSVADFHTHQIQKYNKVLPKEKLNEFIKGIGLAAHGVGIGSFVYLRRIFEHLIQDAYMRAGSTIDSDAFEKARMNEKIKILKDYLPAFLVKNWTLYSILSLGVHELEEKDCLAHFDAVRLGIEMILDEKVIEFEKEQKKVAATKRLHAIHSNLKGGKDAESP